MKYWHLPLVTMFLGACGYTPLYAPITEEDNAGLPVTVGSVRATNPQFLPGERRTAQEVSRVLLQRLPGNGPDTLTVDISEGQGTLAVQRSATVARAEVILTGRVTLTGADGHQHFQTDITSRAAYNVEETPFSTESGRRYARITAARNLADEIARRVALFYRQEALTPAVE